MDLRIKEIKDKVTGEITYRNDYILMQKAYREGFADFPVKMPYGISGERTQHMIFRIMLGEMHKLERSKINNVVLHIGVGNLHYGKEQLCDVVQGILIALDTLRKLPNIDKIFFMNNLPDATSKSVDKNIQIANQMINDWIEERPGQRYHIIDCDSIFRGHPELYKHSDAVHPDEEKGLPLLSKCMSDAIKKANNL